MLYSIATPMKEKIHSFLRYLERFTKTDMVYIAKGSFWLSIGQGVAIISTFALSVVLAHVLSQEVYGNYKFILSLAGIIGGLSLSGLGTAVTQAVARGSDGTLHLAVRTQLLWGIIVALAGLGTAGYYFLNENYLIATSLILVAIALPVTNSTGLYGAFLSGKKDFKRSTLYWVIGQLITTAVIILLAVWTRNVLALVAGFYIVNLFMSIFFYRKTLSIYHPSHDSADKEMIRHGNHLSAMGFIGTIANQLDKVFVFHYAGAAPLAVYAFANAIPEQIRAFLKNIFNIGTPKLALLDKAALRKSITDKVWRLTLITILVVIVYFFAAPFIYKIFFPKYMESVVYSQIYMVGMIVFPGISLFALYFQLLKETKIMYVLTIIGNIATIGFSVLLIPKYGTLGAVLENTLSWVTLFMVSLFLFLKHKNNGAPESPDHKVSE
jgi:O-antigen/teichoic acid export membrane protein